MVAIRQRPLQPVEQQLPVGQACQRIVEGQVLDLFLGRLAFGDVASHRDPVGEAARLVPYRRDLQIDPERLAVLLVVDQVDPRRLPLLHGRPDAVQFAALGARALQQPRRASQHLFAAVTGATLEGLVDEHDARAGIVERPGLGDDDDVVQPRDAAFQQPQLLLGLVPRADVAQVHGQARPEWIAAGLDPGRQVRVEFFHLQHLVGGEAAPELLFQPQPDGLLETAPDRAAQQLRNRAAQQPLGLIVDIAEPSLVIHRHEGFAAAHRAAHADRVAQQGAGAVAMRRDLLHGALHPHDAAFPVAHRMPDRAHPGPAALQGQDLHLLVEGFATCCASLHPIADPLAPLRRIKRERFTPRRAVAGRRPVNGRELVGPFDPVLRGIECPDADERGALKQLQQGPDLLQRVRFHESFHRFDVVPRDGRRDGDMALPAVGLFLRENGDSSGCIADQ